MLRSLFHFNRFTADPTSTYVSASLRTKLVRSSVYHRFSLKHIRSSHNAPKHKLVYTIREDQNVGDYQNSKNDDTNIELSDLELNIGNIKLQLNLTWLRDSCHCTKCTHQYSRQRLFTFKNFNRNLFVINEVKLTNQLNTDQRALLGPVREECSDGYLNIKWLDGHESAYSLSWLCQLQRLYNKSSLKPYSFGKSHEFPKDGLYASSSFTGREQELWNVEAIKSKLKPVDYGHLIDGFKFNSDSTFINANKIEDMTEKRFIAMFSLTDQLVKYGLAHIVNVPDKLNQVLNVTGSLAYERPTGYGDVFNVTIEPSDDINLAYSSLEFDLHSDLTYREISPGVQLLHCIRNSLDGGLSYFADSFYAAYTLKKTAPHLYDVLTNFPITFTVRDPYRDVIFRSHRPVVGQDSQGNIQDVYYSPFSLPPLGFIDDIKLFYLAIDKFTRILQSKENKLVSKMAPGEMFIFHNRRVLHGRSSYDAKTSRRFLQGCYMDWDEIKCLHEKLYTYKVAAK